MDISGNHPTNPPSTQVTTREIADLIDKLIILRIAGSFCTDENDPKAVAVGKEIMEQCEVVKRAIADAFKGHSGAQGVYVDPK